MSQFPRATPRPGRRTVRPGAKQSRVQRHPFEWDESIPLDHRKRKTCSSCRMVGAPGDAHHLAVDEPAQEYPQQDPETRQLELRRLGERDDD
ncbi:hypothetical protein [Dactylosporangium sp. NPDC000521]|uniref:hypothetical protein n=1 Tax=Dactylosporangium sp. NPDC000521 TaxID=3363975 RepID=UPI0036C7218D